MGIDKANELLSSAVSSLAESVANDPQEQGKRIRQAWADMKDGKYNGLNQALRKLGVPFENEPFPNAVPQHYIVTTYPMVDGKETKFRWWNENGKIAGRMIMDWKGKKGKIVKPD